jgi:hypothetical protein
VDVKGIIASWLMRGVSSCVLDETTGKRWGGGKRDFMDSFLLVQVAVFGCGRVIELIGDGHKRTQWDLKIPHSFIRRTPS